MKFIYCRGNNPQAPEIAKQAGMEYGVNYRHKAYAPVYMLDIGIGEQVQWIKYLEAVKRFRPRVAFTYDYIDICQATTLFRQIYDLKMLEVEQIAVCPKFNGAIQHIPESCVVALSVPAPSYAGWLPPDFSVLNKRRCHLLGGSIKTVSDLIPKLQGAGAIIVSADGNHHAKVTNKYGKWWDGHHWVQLRRKKVSGEDLTRGSAVNIMKTIEECTKIAQLGLFG